MPDGQRETAAAQARQLWATLAANGKPPGGIADASNTLPRYSVGIDGWLDRLTERYLRDLCRSAAHFKLVLAPYGAERPIFFWRSAHARCAKILRCRTSPARRGSALTIPSLSTARRSNNCPCPDIRIRGCAGCSIGFCIRSDRKFPNAAFLTRRSRSTGGSQVSERQRIRSAHSVASWPRRCGKRRTTRIRPEARPRYDGWMARSTHSTDRSVRSSSLPE